MASDASPHFVDPRVHPDTPCQRSAAGVASAVEDLDALHQACQAGRLYDVEAWIQAGRPLQLDPETGARARRRTTALAIALETGQYSLALLLLCNGYRLDREPGCPFDLALKARRWDLVDLLWAWGADPTAVDACTLFETYTTPLFERFYAAGADLTRDHELAGTLAYHTSNRPLFGFAKRHRLTDPKIQMELNIALAEHVDEENVKGVHLCLWAGADPHAPAPDLRTTHWLEEDEDDEERFIGWSAVERAVIFGKRDLLPILKPDPARDDFNELYQSARDVHTVDLLAALAPPTNIGAILREQCRHVDPRWPSSGHYPIAVLEEIFKTGARWTESPADEIAWIRRDLLKAKDQDFVEMVKLLTHDEYCSSTILHDLARTPSFRKRLLQVGLLPTVRVLDGHRSESYRMAGYRTILAKFGIPVPKPKA